MAEENKQQNKDNRQSKTISAISHKSGCSPFMHKHCSIRGQLDIHFLVRI